MVSALHVSGTRVISPQEVDQLVQVMQPDHRNLFRVLLYTGVRYSELNQLIENPALFDEERASIVIASTKSKAVHPRRRVLLNQHGIDAVKCWLANPYYVSPGVWNRRMQDYAKQAKLVALPEYDRYVCVDRANRLFRQVRDNIWGINVKSTRKTWESWLVSAHRDKAVEILRSQGHSDQTALDHYINVGFIKAERERIAEQVSGWGEF